MLQLYMIQTPSFRWDNISFFSIASFHTCFLFKIQSHFRAWQQSQQRLWISCENCLYNL